MRAVLLALFMLAASFAAVAGEADVIAVAVERDPGTEDVFNFRVTILSNDIDENYRAEAFEILAPDGRVLGRQEVTYTQGEQPFTQGEQPFTREIENLKIPLGIDRVTVRVFHKPRGYDGQAVTIRLPR